jgi:arabinogalactan oligomer/maltooligosaccharide transport system substrate-binding protein
MKQAAWPLILVLLLGLLMSCGSDVTPTPTVPSPTSTIQPAVAPLVSATPEARDLSAPIAISYWEDDGDAADVLLDALAAEFSELNPLITITRTHFTTEELRDQFPFAASRGEAPVLVRGPGDYIGPFSRLGIIRPIDEVFDASFLAQFFDGALDAATVGGLIWGAPDNYGRHLLLIYNRRLVPSVPVDTSAWIEQLKELTDESAGQYGLVYNLDEPYWLAPWLGGYGAWPLDRLDHPALDTPEVAAALQFVRDLKHLRRVVPPEADYNAADSMFRGGRAAYLIDGDWSLESYRGAGIDFGVAALPLVTETRRYPSPMAIGTFWMFSTSASPTDIEAARLFVAFMTSARAQGVWLEKMHRLPSSRQVAMSPYIQADPILAGTMDQLS